MYITVRITFIHFTLDTIDDGDVHTYIHTYISLFILLQASISDPNY